MTALVDPYSAFVMQDLLSGTKGSAAELIATFAREPEFWGYLICGDFSAAPANYEGLQRLMYVLLEGNAGCNVESLN